MNKIVIGSRAKSNTRMVFDCVVRFTAENALGVIGIRVERFSYDNKAVSFPMMA